MRRYLCFSEGSKINQIICAVLINMPVFAYGTCVGWMSPMSLLLQSENSPRGEPLSDTEISWMASIAYLTCVPGDILVAYVGDKIGRKITLLSLSASCFVLWSIKLLSTETWALVFARSLVGWIMAGCYVTCPLYTKEISEDSVRGVLGSLVILFHTTGNLFVYIIGDILSYNTVLWICLSIPTFHLILFLMMPESPSYLVKTGQREEAVRVVAWLRCRDETDLVVQHEVDTITKEQSNDSESSKFAIKAILKDKILFRAFTIAAMVTIAREVCGSNPILNFAGNIFAMASNGTGLVLTPNQQAMMLGAVQVTGSALASSIVECSGRKPLMIVTAAISGASMCVLASWFLARNYGYRGPAWLPITTLCLCIFCDSAGLLPVSVLLASEIFSYKFRSTVMAICMSTASLADFLQLLFFKPVANYIGVHYAFYFFSIVCLVITIYVILVVPETKMKNLDQIYDKLRKKRKDKQEKTAA